MPNGTSNTPAWLEALGKLSTTTLILIGVGLAAGRWGDRFLDAHLKHMDAQTVLLQTLVNKQQETSATLNDVLEELRKHRPNPP